VELLLNNYYLQVATFICLNALAGLSVYLVLSTGQLTLGNAGFMSLGAYTAALLATKAGAPVWLTLPAAALVPAVVAVPLGYASLRLRGVYLAIATLGFTETVRVLLQNWEFAGGALGVKNIPSLGRMAQNALKGALGSPPAGLRFAQLANLLVLLFVLLVLLLTLFFVYRQERGRVGRAYAAIRIDEIAAEAMGINITYYKILAFVQGAALAGLAGGLVAHINFSVGPTDFAFSRAVEMLTLVVVGGSTTPLGPVLGAALLIGLSEGLRDFSLFGARLSDYRLILYGLLLMLVVALRPQGILGGARRRKEARV